MGAGEPAANSHEALQCFYFLHLITHIIEAYENGISSRVEPALLSFLQG